MPGEMITGRKLLAKDLRVSEQSVRTCLHRLQTIENLTIKSTNKFSIISVTNWDRYQFQDGAINHQINQCLTSNQPAPNHIQELKECKNKDIVLPDKSNNHIPYKEIVDYLNLKSKKNFKIENKITRQHIKARWNEGFKADDFKKVIDVKSKQWLTDEKMNPYLRPQTLFNTKFESYLNEYSQINKSYSVNLDDVAREQYAELEKAKREYWGK
jgi:uncharacterized phage protein (TIGR02220 family)